MRLLFLLFLLTGLCSAQGVSVWNSSTGSTVQIFLNGNSDPVKVRLSTGGKKPREYAVSKVTEKWFQYPAGNATVRATFASADELIVASSDGNNYRWTRRNGKAKYPVPNGEKFEKTYWRADGSSKKYLLLLAKDGCSVMTATPVQGKQKYKAYRARWVDYPRTLQVMGNQPRTFRFLNPMLFREGKTYWYQADPDFEAKK